MSDKTLVFFTTDFPFGNGETFIESELPFLEAAFDQVIIVSNNVTDKQTREINKKTKLVRMPYSLNKKHVLLSTCSLFKKAFWQEYRIIRKTYKKKPSLCVIKTMLISLHKAKQLQKKIQGLTLPNKHVTYYSYWNNDMALALALLKKKHAEIYCFTRMHGWDVYFEANESNYLPYRSLIFTHLDKVFAISKKGKDYYLPWFPEFQNKIEIARLGVPKRKINQTKTNKRIELLSVSNMIPIKNLNGLINALATLDFDFHWTHIGDGSLMSDLKKLAVRKIPGKFTFKGRISNTEVLSYMENKPIDLFVNVSHSEGIPVSIMEAFSCGIPAIATNVGGNAEIVNHAENGFLIGDPNNVIEIAHSINIFEALLFEQKVELRKKAHDTWSHNYNSESNYKRFVAAIDKL